MLCLFVEKQLFPCRYFSSFYCSRFSEWGDLGCGRASLCKRIVVSLLVQLYHCFTTCFVDLVASTFWGELYNSHVYNWIMF